MNTPPRALTGDAGNLVQACVDAHPGRWRDETIAMAKAIPIEKFATSRMRDELDRLERCIDEVFTKSGAMSRNTIIVSEAENKPFARSGVIVTLDAGNKGFER